jgi:hypothetical protein
MSFRKVPRTQCPTGAAEAKDKGQSAARLAAAAVVLATIAVFAGCDLLLGLDTTPPTCRITTPADSSAVNGTVQIVATAFDSVAVERVEFYVDGAIIGTDSSASYSANWDASALAEGSWHSLSCVAYDLEQNRGYSDTVTVKIIGVGQTNVYHGELEVTAGNHEAVWFNAHVGDTLAGEVLVVSGGTLSSLMWMNSDNYQKYIANKSYAVLFEQDDFSQMSLRQGVTSDDRFYLVFANAGGSAVQCWARLVLE